MTENLLPLLSGLEGRLGGLDGKRILVRSDLNVPIKDGVIQDDLRIKESIKTLKWLQDRGSSVVVCTHLGRPSSENDLKFSVEPLRKKLDSLLPGLQLLENLRFNSGEVNNDQAFVTWLVDGAGGRKFDGFVNDAFGASHRSHASIVGPPEFLPSAAGYLLQGEVQILEKLLLKPKKPFIAILGGSKVSDKLGVIESLLNQVDEILIGGGMCFTFLASKGIPIGGSLVENEMIKTCADLIDSGAPIRLPLDFTGLAPGGVIGDPSAGGEVRQFGRSLPEGWMGLDIGPGSAVEFSDAIYEAGSVLWNGPLGVFEDERFMAGTKTVALAMAESRAFTVIGGGDSASAVKKFGVADRIDHISTGGGATLEFLEKSDLPGMYALRNSQRES